MHNRKLTKINKLTKYNNITKSTILTKYNKLTKKKIVTKIENEETLRPVWWPKGPPKKGFYRHYVFSKKELCTYFLYGIVFLGVVSKTFYDSFYAWIFLLPFLYFYLDQKAKELQKKRKTKLEDAFRETILSVASNLQAGFSVENSFLEAGKDIELLYGTESDMAFELRYLKQQLHTNQTLEMILLGLAERTQVEDIREFAFVFQIAKRTGGDLRQVIMNTANVIRDKGMVRQELETVLAEKKLEKTIMSFIPFCLIGYLSLTAKGYFSPLYHNGVGIGIMTGCFLLYLFACFLMKKILEIEI